MAAAVMVLGVVGAVALQFVTLSFVPFPADDGPSDSGPPGVSVEDDARHGPVTPFTPISFHTP
ncbi:hypothetical protein [Streptomyces sp. AB3(2024)]|uniref:hypothetical protein n=1 Tax=Streptomyces sp. AB3(2024) TaxID=3317321 RepID=UPI0035A2BE4D